MTNKTKRSLHLKCCLVFENKSKLNKYYIINIKVNKIKRRRESGIWHMLDSQVRYIVTFVFKRSLA